MTNRPSKFSKLLSLEWRYTYKSARRDGWSRKYSFTLFLGQILHGIAEIIEYREGNDPANWNNYDWEEYRRERESI